MKHTLRFARFISCLLIVVQLGISTPSSALPLPAHIVIVILENYAYSQIIGSSNAPHINALATDPHSAVFTQCYAVEHPSQPNYLAFFSGSDQGNHDDNIPAGVPFTTPNLASQLITAGKTFVTYSEDLPAAGFNGSSSSLYVRKHNPVTNWQGTGTNQVTGTVVNQPFTAFPTSKNYSTLPTISYVVPNEINDMHDGSFPSNIVAGDNWVYKYMDTLKQWAMVNNTLYVVTFDEDDNLHSNQIATIFYGPMVKGGSYSEHIDFYNILRTFEEMYGLGYAGAAATATTITDCWLSNAYLGVNSNTTNTSFRAVPNPANEQVTFVSDAALAAPVTVVVSDVLGRVTGKYTMDNSRLTINTSNFAPGAYVYKVMDNASLLDQGKIIISGH